MPFSSYEHIIVAFSGGKDSIACFLRLIEAGVPKEKIELWHHLVDGVEETFIDWPVTKAYCDAFAKQFGVPIYHSWRKGGFLAEMNRDNSATAPVIFEALIDGKLTYKTAGGKGPPGTRKKFPQVSSNLSVRWCSSALKIDVSSAAIRGQPRFLGKRTLFITGERAEESAARANYKVFEPHRVHTKSRHIDHMRPILHYSTRQVWDIMARHNVNPHPAYRMGWGRVSCAGCIFGSKDQWASLNEVSSIMVSRLARAEKETGFTIHRTKTVMNQVVAGTPYPATRSRLARLAFSKEYKLPVVVNKWKMPAGAFAEATGPT